MAFINDQEEEEDGKMDTVVSPQMGATIGAQQAQSGAPQGSGSFTNIKQYIEANKPKSQQMTQNIQSGITGAAEQLRSDVAGQREQSLGAGSQITQESQRLATGEQDINQAIQTAGQADATGADKFAKLREIQAPSYVAPELTQQRASAADLQRRSQAFGTEAGRREELARTVGKESDRYTSGQRSLDALLLSGDKQGRAQAIRNTRTATTGLGGQIDTLQSDIGQRLGEQSNKRQALSEYAKGQVGEARSGLREDLEARRGQVSSENQAVIERLRGAFSPTEEMIFNPETKQMVGTGKMIGPSRNVSEEDLKTLGLEGSNLSSLYGANPTELFRSENTTLAGVATAEDQARLNALAGLAGGDATSILQGADIGGAGITGGDAFLNEIHKGRTGFETGLSGLDQEGTRESTLKKWLIDSGQAKNANDVEWMYDRMTNDVSNYWQPRVGEYEQWLGATENPRLRQQRDQLHARYGVIDEAGKDVGGINSDPNFILDGGGKIIGSDA